MHVIPALLLSQQPGYFQHHGLGLRGRVWAVGGFWRGLGYSWPRDIDPVAEIVLT